MGEAEKKSDRPLYVTPTHDTIRLLLAEAPGAGLKVYMALSLRADWKTGEAHPSYETLKREHGLSRDVIARGITELVELGLLVKQRRFSSSTVYFLRGLAGLSPSPLISRPQSPENQTTDKCLPAAPTTPNVRSTSSSPKSRGMEAPVVRKSDYSPLKIRLQSPAFPDANERQYNERQLNEGGTPPPLPSAREDLVKRTKDRKIFAVSDAQRLEVVEALISEHGFEGAAEVIERAKVRDVLKLLRESTKPSNGRSPPPRKRKPDPNCKGCGGKGRRLNPVTGKEMDCGKCVTAM